MPRKRNEERRAKVKELFHQGATDAEIASELDISAEYVRDLRLGMGLKRPQPEQWSNDEIEAVRRELLEQGKTLEEIARREGVSRQRINQVVGRLNRGNSRAAARTQQIGEMAKARIPDAEIARRTGLSLSSVRVYRNRAGIKFPARRRQEKSPSA